MSERTNSQLLSKLDHVLNEAIIEASASHYEWMTIKSLKLAILLKVLEWTGTSWNRLKELTHYYTFVNSEVANRFSNMIRSDEDNTILFQMLVKPTRLARVLSNVEEPVKSLDSTICLINGGSVADERDAILAVDGLISRPFPNYDMKKYLDNCRFALSGEREYMSEDEDDRRVHVQAVRNMYSRIPLRILSREDKSRSACHIVFGALRQVYQIDEIFDDREDRIDEDNLMPFLAEFYVQSVGQERLKRLISNLPVYEKKRGRKRKTHAELLTDEKSSENDSNCGC